jgi:hypothetical protein
VEKKQRFGNKAAVIREYVEIFVSGTSGAYPNEGR